MQNNSPLVLLILEGGYPWYYGGVSEWTHQYLRNLGSFDFSILQITNAPWDTASFEKAIYPLNKNIISFDRITAPELDENISDRRIQQWINDHLKRISSSQTPDVIHITNTGFAGLLGSKLADQLAKPLLLTEHAIYWKEIELGAQSLECGYQITSHDEHKKQIKNLFRHISKRLYQDADEIVSVSESNLPWQEELGATDVRYIPNGIPSDFLAKNRIIREADEHIPIVGWIGRCAHIKQPLRFLDLVKGLSHVMNGRIHFKMLLSDSGEDGLKAEILRKSRDIENLDLFWNEPSEDHLPSMDALFITSQSESQPLVMLEALGKKVLPFGWEVGDATGEYGIFEPQDTPMYELAEKFKKLWKSPVKWRKVVDSRFKKVESNHTWEYIFDRYKDTMTDLILN